MEHFQSMALACGYLMISSKQFLSEHLSIIEPIMASAPSKYQKLPEDNNMSLCIMHRLHIYRRKTAKLKCLIFVSRWLNINSASIAFDHPQMMNTCQVDQFTVDFSKVWNLKVQKEHFLDLGLDLIIYLSSFIQHPFKVIYPGGLY